MKRINTSLKKTGILFSLVLLSPGVMAAENLNFNYTRAGALSLDPRMSLQARACHSKGDPININFRLNSLRQGTPHITLAIKGKSYSKSYSVFPATKSMAGKAGAGDFTVPFSIKKNGTASGANVVTVHHDAVPAQFGEKFCFMKATGGKIAVLENTPGLPGHSYEQVCRNKPVTLDPRFNWGGNPNGGAPQPDYIPDSIIFNHVFFTSYTPGKPARDEQQWQDVSGPVSDNGDVVSELYGYALPIPQMTDGGNFTFNLSNRNITTLRLDIKVSGQAVYTWLWEKSKDNPNILRLTYTNPVQVPMISPGPADSNSDPYARNHFYTGNSFYKGTLASENSLSQKYTDYIKNIIPLSLPSDSNGNINLVNTDSLSFVLQKNGDPDASQGFMKLSVFGQPLQFGPLKVNDKDVASAMQIRNACY
ncbi:hypothetical protein F4V72_00355 [Salmonella enterica subsp. diarizonae]|uniref:Uncharacterized protein n=1 Tax=Salmonella diarizonae TaxID=59204 RepID=A0A379TUS2_SALDZ|nr:hypothetical protein [Salmonella enterica]ECH9339994.1 hypothetical protein [Salmonella enterica subsp. diarizonae]EDU9900431.1 hypothetical protein [Salmonella enterica subsp. diarizonae]KAA8692205.1 hypothetical protein F4V72_00355 [Salmonella enterica subsp. diarizonae]SUG54367.1 Uncharacterised protein [Salmonella enterica subsp. diarizonae]VFS68610.1 Uncharacterised protein [Salmonella enterica subsp. diarizonae]